MDTEARIARFKELWQSGESYWAEDIVDEINGELSDDEFKLRHVDQIEEDTSRWMDHMLDIVEINEGVFVGVRWESGKTEMQENMYEDDSVYLLERVEKVITTVEWNDLKTL
ncbi:hypothetical protein SEA_YABOI_129 [Streptomyces phage Yaboi]|uniref:Uncharacterized protein n=3 Tax=Streptomyces virus Yaboi TaxID=2846408 RepID=A0A385UIG2_9CAUD|nr:hypothetical protein HWB86_gp164 [Streptomyces phage Yaboi]QAY08780.1 hypothetical protein SEA_GENIE2_130 [Streptomyces phage Genie2]QAY12770.1 hypothetical protein SEA_BOOMERJR_130 [Streptomyces phage BoomerJR]UVD39964.1 hypothetical protein SEA_STANIMAL_128 [Streptomyces phage Stanimal]WNM73706.1 hypothetical protein SEA_SOLLERTIA_129 [Streptomyces phage Sollertia]AYB70955.1 hypothetical protein SEA_YABOI_129 [Streptomyces phage Yaboi]